MRRTGNRRRTHFIGSLAAVTMMAPPASAAIIGPCTIMIGGSGTMTASPSLNVLGSKQPGGSYATVTVNPQSLLCNILALIDCYSISTPAPASFLTAPSGAADNLSFATVFRINGGPDRPGNTPVMVANGTKTIEIDLTATKATGIFPSGSYQAQVTVRCE